MPMTRMTYKKKMRIIFRRLKRKVKFPFFYYCTAHFESWLVVVLLGRKTNWIVFCFSVHLNVFKRFAYLKPFFSRSMFAGIDASPTAWDHSKIWILGKSLHKRQRSQAKMLSFLKWITVLMILFGLHAVIDVSICFYFFYSFFLVRQRAIVVEIN